MASAFEPLPNDVAALKAALVAERDKSFEIAVELAVARAKASEDTALIAAQKLRIAKLERQIYGQRSERSARQIEQVSLAFEELEASATEDELAAEAAVEGHDRPRPHAPRRRAKHVPRSPAARARRDRSPDRLRMLRRQSPAQTRRRRDADAGDCEFRRNPARDSDLMSATVPI
jgi:capsule polysaccharide export protein KpsE/RkpR